MLGVADIMQAEAEEIANAALDRASGRANGIAAITPERVIREGDPGEQILDVIENDVDIAMLVLAASARCGGSRSDHHHAGENRRHISDPDHRGAGQSRRYRYPTPLS